MACQSECEESSTTRFVWKLRGVQELLDNSKGEVKSEVIKSTRFGGGESQWQLLLYANSGPIKENPGAHGSGSPGGEWISLYLSCEPTPEEEEIALSTGKWSREGIYKFHLEMRSLGNILFSKKTSTGQTFSSKSPNWGWIQFVRRSDVTSLQDDGWVISCTVESTPRPSEPVSPISRLRVPQALLETVGSLLLEDNSAYSDTEFIISKCGQARRGVRRIFASKQLLSRAQYFRDMFNSGFSEDAGVLDTALEPALDLSLAEDDSDAEDGDEEDDPAQLSARSDTPVQSQDGMRQDPPQDSDLPTLVAKESSAAVSQEPISTAPTYPPIPYFPLPAEHGRPKRTQVVVNDFCYNTYLGMLYYIYTDTIVFAPLSSSFEPQEDSDVDVSSSGTQSTQSGSSSKPRTRRQWIFEWQKAHPRRPPPCSAKSIYRLADKLGLDDLKVLATRHIIRSLTVETIGHEVFSPFAATFKEMRKLQIQYFLENWAEVRNSTAMRNVWQQIRNGKHPGFEEVWPVIVSSLVFNPKSEESVDNGATPHRDRRSVSDI